MSENKDEIKSGNEGCNPSRGNSLSARDLDSSLDADRIAKEAFGRGIFDDMLATIAWRILQNDVKYPYAIITQRDKR